MATLELPELSFNTEGWGPSDNCLPKKYKDLPYQPFCKKDQIGRVADWTGNNESRRTWGRQWTSGMPVNLPSLFDVDQSFKFDTSEKGDFNLVNADQNVRKPFQKWGNKFNQQGGNNAKITQTQEYQNNRTNNTIGGRRPQNNKKKFNNRRTYQKNIQREHSIKVDPTWKTVEHYQLPNLQKYFMKQPDGVDVLITGEARGYDKNFDNVNRKHVRLNPKVIDNLDFQHPTTMEDKGFKELLKTQKPKKALIMGTDNIISTIMCMGRSFIPWDLTVHKSQGYVIFDNARPEDSYNPIDTITVSETASEHVPTDESVDEKDKAVALTHEATTIQHISAQQVLRPEAKAKVFKKSAGLPYELKEDHSAPGKLYRYRKFPLDKEGEIELLVRTSVDAWEGVPKKQMKRPDMPNFVNICCLNEWNPKYASGIYWNKYLEKQTSTILATELKNNNFRTAKWIMNAKMADVANVKLAYVQREKGDNRVHNMVNMETYDPKTLAQTANLNTENCWGVLKHIIDAIMKESDGDFHIVKEPNKSEVYIYKEVGDESSSEEETSSEEEEDSDSEEGESGEDSGSGSESDASEEGKTKNED